MILEKETYNFGCGHHSQQQRSHVRYLVQCDNPDCGKQTWRNGSSAYYMNKRRPSKSRLSSHHYCNRGCDNAHTIGVCSKPECTKLITQRKVTFGEDDGLCTACSSNKRSVLARARVKKELFGMLGDICACCGEKDKMYLEIDHVHNDGSVHRKVIYKNGFRKNGLNMSHSNLKKHLKENPGSLQILCCNCNKAKHKNGGELYTPDKFTQRKCLAA